MSIGQTESVDSGNSVNEIKRQQPLPLGHGVPSPATPIRELMGERAREWFALVNAVQHGPKRKILVAVNHLGTPMYEDIAEYVRISKRTIRHHVASLEDEGILVRASKPAIVTYVDEDVAALAHDAVALAYEAEGV